MLRECVEVFQQEIEKYSEAVILDSYIPADGTYIIVKADGKMSEPVDIMYNKKKHDIDRSHILIPKICYYDYHTKLLSMNKPMDSKKIIHTNSYLGFAVKKDSIVGGKLTGDVIDDYYDTLKNPLEQKYKTSKEATTIYHKFEQEEGCVEEEQLEKIRKWIKENVFNLEQVDITKKNYLKIFFEAPEDIYEREERRYVLPNIYNSNEYNIEIEDEIYGLPDNNVGMNAKKPFLSIKTRKYPSPYLLDGDRVLEQKQFFDYLWNCASAGKYNVYVDTEECVVKAYRNGDAPEYVRSGYYLRIQKGKKEAEIIEQDNIAGYQQKISRPFLFQNILSASHRTHSDYQEAYREYYTRLQMGQLIDEVFFFKLLSGNYFQDATSMNINDSMLRQAILTSRDVFHSWIYRGIDQGFYSMVDKVSLNLIKRSVLNDYKERAMWQMNLRWSLAAHKEGGVDMAEILTELRRNVKERVLAKRAIPLENDNQYYYVVGQLAGYLISLNKSKKLVQSLINPILNARDNQSIKQALIRMYKKYNYDIDDNFVRVKHLFAVAIGYEPNGAVNQEMILLGYMDDKLVYYKEEK